MSLKAIGLSPDSIALIPSFLSLIISLIIINLRFGLLFFIAIYLINYKALIFLFKARFSILSSAN